MVNSIQDIANYQPNRIFGYNDVMMYVHAATSLELKGPRTRDICTKQHKWENEKIIKLRAKFSLVISFTSILCHSPLMIITAYTDYTAPQRIISPTFYKQPHADHCCYNANYHGGPDRWLWE